MKVIDIEGYYIKETKEDSILMQKKKMIFMI